MIFRYPSSVPIPTEPAEEIDFKLFDSEDRDSLSKAFNFSYHQTSKDQDTQVFQSRKVPIVEYRIIPAIARRWRVTSRTDGQRFQTAHLQSCTQGALGQWSVISEIDNSRHAFEHNWQHRVQRRLRTAIDPIINVNMPHIRARQWFF